MKVAIVADIHANLPALKAVLADIKNHSVDEIWHLGDLVGYSAFPNEVIKVMQDRSIKGIKGNYDVKALNFHSNNIKKPKNPSKIFSFQWTSDQLTEESKLYLNNLPESLELRFRGLKIFLAHGSPDKIDEPLTIDTPQKRFEELAAKTKVDVVLFGHTHVYFTRKAAKTLFINPGSVGRPFDNDPRASYVILNFLGKKVDVYNYRVKYPLKETINKMVLEKFPEDIIASISEGKSLDDVADPFNQIKHNQAIERIIGFAKDCNYDQDHSHQVVKLALRMFDELKDLHQLSLQEKVFLHSAGLLHDIGWVNGRKGHHKASRDIILKSRRIPFDLRGKIIVALTARYHRKTMPKERHKYYKDLSSNDKSVVRKLAAMLRVADGLDRRHINNVRDLYCEVLSDKVILHIDASEFTKTEESATRKKGNLFAKVFGRTLIFNWQTN